MNNTITIDRHTFELSNLDKILFPQAKITKGDLIAYYHQIAPFMLVHLKDRALTMQRFPEGIAHEGFFQKDASAYFPSWIKQKAVAKKEDGGGTTSYVVCNNTATLVYLANQACITIHRWLSKIDKLHNPDLLIFDLDPSTSDFSIVRTTALDLKKILEEINLVPFVMTTGQHGLHVIAPLKRTRTFDEVRAHANEIAEELIKRNPETMTLEIRKNKRGIKLFIDTHRNAFTATAVTPYSVRAHSKASVATPLHWDEVKSACLRSDMYTVENIFKRLEKIEDPWKDFFKKARTF
ncbi:MAG: non-homologous end-joining DNA ligase [Candidatus Babeliaceae bacterium]